jgi:hypothetical protein
MLLKDGSIPSGNHDISVKLHPCDTPYHCVQKILFCALLSTSHLYYTDGGIKTNPLSTIAALTSSCAARSTFSASAWSGRRVGPRHCRIMARQSARRCCTTRFRACRHWHTQCSDVAFSLFRLFGLPPCSYRKILGRRGRS